MRTVSFKQLLQGVARQNGLDPESGDLPAELAQTYTEFIQARLREGREWAWWPELTVCEVRAVDVADDYLIPLTETGKQTIEHVRFVTNKDPFQDPTYRCFSHQLNSRGINLLMGATLPDELYVTYRPRMAMLDSTEWLSTPVYAVGDVRYVPSTGDCWECIATSQAQSPPASSANWTRINIPYLFLNWIRYAAGSDALRENGQHEKADRLLDRAFQELYRLEDVELTQQRQVSRADVVTQ